MPCLLSVAAGNQLSCLACLPEQCVTTSYVKSISGISERMLVAQLRELEQHGLVKRIIYPEVPPKVEYELTSLGLSTKPMLQSISEWGNMQRAKNEKVT